MSSLRRRRVSNKRQVEVSENGWNSLLLASLVMLLSFLAMYTTVSRANKADAVSKAAKQSAGAR